jgi:hypothetical protein
MRIVHVLVLLLQTLLMQKVDQKAHLWQQQRNIFEAIENAITEAIIMYAELRSMFKN